MYSDSFKFDIFFISFDLFLYIIPDKEINRCMKEILRRIQSDLNTHHTLFIKYPIKLSNQVTYIFIDLYEILKISSTFAYNTNEALLKCWFASVL